MCKDTEDPKDVVPKGVVPEKSEDATPPIPSDVLLARAQPLPHSPGGYSRQGFTPGGSRKGIKGMGDIRRSGVSGLGHPIAPITPKSDPEPDLEEGEGKDKQ